MQYIVHGDCLEVMKSYADNIFSSIVTDPPYGLSFMGKDWDHGIPGVPYWKEALRICKPGSFMLAFGGTRTYHRLACAIEDAGWEVRDCIQWIYGSGFPKSHNKFGLEGYGTALKPAYEPILVAMKKCEGTFAKNAEKWGQAGLNIDGCRISCDLDKEDLSRGRKATNAIFQSCKKTIHIEANDKGRWPANVILDEEAGVMLDEQSGVLKSGKVKPYKRKGKNPYSGGFGDYNNTFSSSKGGASRFFYCAKASPSERGQNNHPTVKPLKLMKYLLTLVSPPKDGLILDPFAGSGSTIVAAKHLNINAIGIEKESEYVEIAASRINSLIQQELMEVNK